MDFKGRAKSPPFVFCSIPVRNCNSEMTGSFFGCLSIRSLSFASKSKKFYRFFSGEYSSAKEIPAELHRSCRPAKKRVPAERNRLMMDFWRLARPSKGMFEKEMYSKSNNFVTPNSLILNDFKCFNG